MRNRTTSLKYCFCIAVALGCGVLMTNQTQAYTIQSDSPGIGFPTNGTVDATLQVALDEFVANSNTSDPQFAVVFMATLLGDVNLDGQVTFADIGPLFQLILTGGFSAEADINSDGVVDRADALLFPRALLQ